MNLLNYDHIVVLTGAGISKASGLPTYRGEGGLWNSLEADEQPTVELAQRAPEKLWNIFGPMKFAIQKAEPNPAHLALARLEHKLASGKTLQIITQNIDGLHQRAGSQNVIELHGSIFRTLCTDGQCSLAPIVDDPEVYAGGSSCSLCGQALRPDLVLFGEAIPAEQEWLSKRALRECSLFLAIGTSGTVAPASNFARSAKYMNAHTVCINAEEAVGGLGYFDRQIVGRAEEILPELVGE